MGEIGIAAVDAPDRDHPQGGRPHRHDPDLHVRRVGPEEEPVVEVEGVVHGPRRVVGGNVERLEVVEVVLDLGTFQDVEPEVAERRSRFVRGSGSPGGGPRRAARVRGG